MPDIPIEWPVNYTLHRTCPNCERSYTPFLLTTDPVAFVQAYTPWKAGMMVQDAFPDSTSEQREQLLTGMCSDACWNEFLDPMDTAQKGIEE